MIPHSLRHLAVLPVLCSAAAAQGVVLNEFVYDDGANPDTREFVEIYNASGGPVDISNWTLESRDDQGLNFQFPVPPGTILQAGQFYVFGPSTGSVPLVDQQVGTTDILEDDTESLTLRDASQLLVDSVVYEAFRGLGAAQQLLPFVEGEGIWGELVSIDSAGPRVAMGWSRARDGQDTNDNRDFVQRPITPGAPNGSAVLSGPLFEKVFDDYEATALGSELTGWMGSAQMPVAVTPTVAAPRGARVGQLDDPTGAGNTATFLVGNDAPGVMVEGYFFFPTHAGGATPAPGDFESWSFGIQGTTGAPYVQPDPDLNFPNLLGRFQNGNTGLSWTYQATASQAILYLVDHGNGGWGPNAQSDPIVHARIPIVAGLNDGWRRLRLQVADGVCEAFFDGEPGCREFSWTFNLGSFVTAQGSVYMGYRHTLANPASRTPLSFDDLDARFGPASGIYFYGNEVPNSFGAAARIAFDQIPMFGDSNVVLRFSGLTPGLPATLYIGLSNNFQIPLDLFGAPAGVTLLVDQYQSFSLSGNAAGITAVQSFTICTPLVGGFDMYFQVLVFDPGLLGTPGVTLPLACSRGVRMIIG